MVMVLLIMAAGTAVAGYSFSFTCRTDTLKRVQPGGEAVVWFTLSNTGDERDAYRFDCRVLDSVPGSTVIYCIGGLCAEPGLPLYDSLPAGETDTAIDVSVFAGPGTGDELVLLSVRSLGEPALTDSILTHTEVSAGIGEERPGHTARGNGLAVVPNPAPAGRAAVRFFLERAADCRLEAFSASGSMVAGTALGRLEPGPHETAWQLRLPRGVYVLRLVAGRSASCCPVVVR